MNDALHSSPNPVLTLRPYLQLSASSKEPLELQTFNGPRMSEMWDCHLVQPGPPKLPLKRS